MSGTIGKFPVAESRAPWRAAHALSPEGLNSPDSSATAHLTRTGGSCIRRELHVRAFPPNGRLAVEVLDNDSGAVVRRFPDSNAPAPPAVARTMDTLELVK